MNSAILYNIGKQLRFKHDSIPDGQENFTAQIIEVHFVQYESEITHSRSIKETKNKYTNECIFFSKLSLSIPNTCDN
jgi:hypothetical protein